MSGKVLLLYGSGPNVGAGILKKFASEGWKTAAIVRTLKEEYKNSADLVIQGDFADAKAVQKIYDEVEGKLGTPSCVVYNGESTFSLTRRPLVSSHLSYQHCTSRVRVSILHVAPWPQDSMAAHNCESGSRLSVSARSQAELLLNTAVHGLESRT